MAQHWTSRVTFKAREMGRVLANRRQSSWADDADARRIRTELDAIRARFPDHA